MFLGRVDVLGSIHLYIKVYNPRIKKIKKKFAQSDFIRTFAEEKWKRDERPNF